MFSLKNITNWLEDSIITVSMPALAISGIIAGVDLLMGSAIMTQIHWMSLAWVITLLISLDFQVLSLGARAHKIYQRRQWGELILAVLIAAGISFVSVQMQSIIARSNTVGVDINTATMQLGINPIWLIWERSALVLLLIFLSGWFRECEQGKQGAQEGEQNVQDVHFAITAELPVVPLLEGKQNSEQGEQVRTFLARNPALTDRELADLVGCSVSTANTWKRRIQA